MDEQLRHREREALHGDIEDQVRHLRELIRSGSIPGWVPWVGCSLGDPASLTLCELPLDHRESCVELFDVLCANAPARVVLEFLAQSLVVWVHRRELEHKGLIGGLSGGPELLRLLDPGLRQGMDLRVLRDVARAVLDEDWAAPFAIPLRELVEGILRTPAKVIRKPTSHLAFRGTNPVAFGHWLDRDGTHFFELGHGRPDEPGQAVLRMRHYVPPDPQIRPPLVGQVRRYLLRTAWPWLLDQRAS